MIEQYSLSKEDAKQVLLPYGQLFYDAIVNGFEDYKINDLKNAHIHNNTTKSNLIRSYVIHRVKMLVIENPKLKLIEQKRMILVLVEDKVVVRFKKLSNDFRSQNIQTNQVTQFRKRTLNFQGVTALPIDAGWRLDEFYNSIEDISFVCPNGKNNLWRIPLEDLSATNVQPMVIPVEKEEIIEIVRVKPHLINANRKAAN